MNKKLDRFKQWAGERMGAESKTLVSDDFKALEDEMAVRMDGLEKLHKSVTAYVKALSRKSEIDDRERTFPIGHMGSVMVTHGHEFAAESTFGACLINFGRVNQILARCQEAYVAAVKSNWLESLERSLVQMREFQASRKKMEQRRLAYDASLTKVQKAKKEDFRSEEELRAQKAKCEDSNDDVLRRMLEIRESESETIGDLSSFLDAELAYHDDCRAMLLQLKKDWPANSKLGRPRANTVQSCIDNRLPLSPEENISGLASRAIGMRSSIYSKSDRMAAVAAAAPPLIRSMTHLSVSSPGIRNGSGPPTALAGLSRVNGAVSEYSDNGSGAYSLSSGDSDVGAHLRIGRAPVEQEAPEYQLRPSKRTINHGPLSNGNGGYDVDRLADEGRVNDRSSEDDDNDHNEPVRSFTSSLREEQRVGSGGGGGSGSIGSNNSAGSNNDFHSTGSVRMMADQLQYRERYAIEGNGSSLPSKKGPPPPVPPSRLKKPPPPPVPPQSASLLARDARP